MEGSPKLKVTFEQEQADRARIVLQGDLDASSLQEAWLAALDPLVRQDIHYLTVDLTALAYLDNAGIGLFAEFRRLTVERGGALNFIGCTADYWALLSHLC